LPKGRN
jgi:hypothetical protein